MGGLYDLVVNVVWFWVVLGIFAVAYLLWQASR